MESLKLYGINITALITTSMDVNSLLQTMVLLSTLVYTVLQIFLKIKNNKQDK